jgi:hypothetical protein
MRGGRCAQGPLLSRAICPGRCPVWGDQASTFTLQRISAFRPSTYDSLIQHTLRGLTGPQARKRLAIDYVADLRLADVTRRACQGFSCGAS